MANSTPPDRTLDLREFIKENDQRVYDFCTYLLAGDFAVEDLVLDIFRDFGEFYRRSPTGDDAIASSEMRNRLFQIAWSHILNGLYHTPFTSMAGRDTRLLKGLDDDLLPAKTGRDRALGEQESRVRDRLAQVDAELRAPLVLRDILKFSDEDVAKILGLRWGVYRHRLHRGRLDFKDALKGLTTGMTSGRGSSASA